MATYWERREDPTTWTTIDNTPIDDDLSDAALGLLVRWLRRPPNEPLWSIRTMCEFDRMRGKTATDGKTARENKACELERKGYLVRKRWQGENGRWNTTVSIGAVPVPPEQRSDPDARKRSDPDAPKRPKKNQPKKKHPKETEARSTEVRKPGFGATSDDDTKPQVAPKPGNRASGDRASGPRAAFLGHSVKSSSSAATPTDEVDPSSSAKHQDDDEEHQEQKHVGELSGPATPSADAHASEASEFLAALPGELGPRSVETLLPLVLAALAAGWTLEALGKRLRSTVNPARCNNVTAVYRAALQDLPTPPATRSVPAQAAADRCPQHPGMRLIPDEGCPLCATQGPRVPRRRAAA